MTVSLRRLSPCGCFRLCQRLCLSLSTSFSVRFSGSLSQLSYFAFLSLCLVLSTRLFGSVHLAQFLSPSFCLHFCFSLSPLLSRLFIVCVSPLAVKDLDTEKYFHLVSALPPALGVPALHWVSTWLPATLGLWGQCLQALGKAGVGSGNGTQGSSRAPRREPSAHGGRVGPPTGGRGWCLAPALTTDHCPGLPGAAHG